MKSIITVEGKQYEAEMRMWGFYDENDEYRAISQSEVEKVEYEDRYEPVEQLLRKRIAAHEEILADYEAQLMNEYKANQKAPFASDNMRRLAEKHQILTNVVEGLCEALVIVTNDAHMQDDVDLSGGEEVD